MSAVGRMRFLYCLNILLPGWLALYHLFAPELAAQQLWQGGAAGGGGGGGGGGAARPSALTLPVSMLGSWWAAIALLSVAGLFAPYKFSPIMLVQMVYKLAFLSTAIAPLAISGRWSAFPTAPTAVFAAYLPLLLACAPWSYLLGRGQAEDRSKKAE